MTAYEFIRERIVMAFHDLAEEASKMDLKEDEAAGIPMTLFVAEMALLEFWKQYTKPETVKS